MTKSILSAAPPEKTEAKATHDEEVRCVEVTRPAYYYLRDTFDGVSDEHRMQLLLRQLRGSRGQTRC